jgi:hypothetical protein
MHLQKPSSSASYHGQSSSSTFLVASTSRRVGATRGNVYRDILHSLWVLRP